MKALVRALLATVVTVVTLSIVSPGRADAWIGCLPRYDPETHRVYTLCY